MVQKDGKNLKFLFQFGHGLFLCCGIRFLPKYYFLTLICATLSQTWMYLAVPILLYACERLIRALRSGYKTVRILKVHFNDTDTIIIYKFNNENKCVVYLSLRVEEIKFCCVFPGCSVPWKCVGIAYVQTSRL